MEQRAPDAQPACQHVSRTHLVLIPSYNTGERLFSTVSAARAQWSPVWVVVDGSTDGTGERLQQMAAADPGLRVWLLPQNQGKGAAVLHGLRAAQEAGFTHALTMDSDGQHPADLIPAFMQASQARPETMVLGRPVFDASAPLLRVRGRRVSNGWTQLETLFAGIGDSLYGFRVYPVADADRDDGAPALDAPLRLRHRGRGAPGLARRQAGQHRCAGQVPHGRGRRRLALPLLARQRLLTWMHTRLMLEFVLRLPGLLLRRCGGRRRFSAEPSLRPAPAAGEAQIIPPLIEMTCPVM